jgi:DNA-binding transcriptional LysR family regulator
MNFQQLKFVREAARNGFNLTGVAETLFISQSGVSKQIKELEVELGVELFVRKGKRLVGLTRAGEGAIPLIERILLETENLKRFSSQFAEQDKGSLVIATTHNQARYALPRAIREFTARYPDVKLELIQGAPKYVGEAVIRGAADLAIATDAFDSYPELAAYPCFTWNHVVIAPPDHPLTRLESPTLADIREYSIITYSPGFSGRPQIDAAFAREGLVPDIRLTAMDADIIKTYVEMGLGVGILSEMAMVDERRQTLKVLDAPGRLFAPCVTQIAIRRGALLRGYAYKFIETFAPHLTQAELVKGATHYTPPRRSAAAPAAGARDEIPPVWSSGAAPV